MKVYTFQNVYSPNPRKIYISNPLWWSQLLQCYSAAHLSHEPAWNWRKKVAGEYE